MSGFLLLWGMDAQGMDTLKAFTSSHSKASKDVGAEIVRLATHQRYERALEMSDQFIRENAQEPYGYLLRATVLVARAMDYEDELDFQDIERACLLTEQRTHEGKVASEAEHWFYLGMAQMYRSIVYHRQHSWFKALDHVLQGGKYFETATERDSTYWDAHYGWGMYLYHRSQQAGLLRSVGVIPDRREEGIRHIEIAAHKGHLTAISARNSLAWIALQKGDYAEAIRRSRQLVDEFPDVRSFRWCLGRALIKAERWEEAIAVYRTQLSSVRAEERNNHYNEISCLHNLAHAHSALVNWGEVIRLADEALALELSEEVHSKKRKDLERLRGMRREAVGQIAHNAPDFSRGQ